MARNGRQSSLKKAIKVEDEGAEEDVPVRRTVRARRQQPKVDKENNSNIPPEKIKENKKVVKKDDGDQKVDMAELNRSLAASQRDRKGLSMRMLLDRPPFAVWPHRNQNYFRALSCHTVANLVLPRLIPVPISLYQVQSPRIMSMEWHPKKPNVLLVGGKHGEILYLSDFENMLPDSDKEPGSKNVLLNEGIGPAGGITTIKFDPHEDNIFYTSTIRGTIASCDLADNSNLTIFQTEPSTRHCLDHWFTGLDVHQNNKLLYVGDNKGGLHTMPCKSNSGYSSHKLHNSKIHCVDFHPRDSNVFATSSVDKTVKIWDVRMLSSKKPTKVLKFDGPINSGFFSRTNGGTFVTTGQKGDSSIKFFNVANWECMHSVSHRHDQFQHLTAIKATWHPLADIVAVGRYTAQDKPNSNSIDFIDAHTGQIVHEINPTNCSGIKSVNVFNCLGDSLATGMGSNVIVWKRQEFMDGLREKVLKARREGRFGSAGPDDGDDGGPAFGKKRKPKARTKKDAPSKKTA